MPGTNVNGYVFDERVDGALETMYDNGDRNAVVFSHGGTIMFWTMMNVNNLTATAETPTAADCPVGQHRLRGHRGQPRGRLDIGELERSAVRPRAHLGNEVKLQVRTLTRQLDAAHQQVVSAFATGDFTTIATAVNRGIADAGYSVAKFTRAVNAKVIHEVDQALAPESPAPASAKVSTVNSATDTVKKRNASVASKPEAVETSVASNGATDLGDGNKSVPGEPQTRPARPGQRLLNVLKDVSDRITNSVRKLDGIGTKKTDGPCHEAPTASRTAADPVTAAVSRAMPLELATRR